MSELTRATRCSSRSSRISFADDPSDDEEGKTRGSVLARGSVLSGRGSVVGPIPATQLLVSVQLKAGETVCATPLGSKTVQNTHFTVVKLVKTFNQDSFCIDYPAFISVGYGTRPEREAVA